MWKEFKEFAIKGNVIDLAVGVIIGGAFSKIVASLVKDVLTPLTSMLLGGENFSHLKYKSFTYGNFIQSVIDFLIISFSIFLFVKFINRFKKKEAPAVQKIDRQEELLAEIRDLLKVNKEFDRNNETS